MKFAGWAILFLLLFSTLASAGVSMPLKRVSQGLGNWNEEFDVDDLVRGHLDDDDDGLHYRYYYGGGGVLGFLLLMFFVFIFAYLFCAISSRAMRWGFYAFLAIFGVSTMAIIILVIVAAAT